MLIQVFSSWLFGALSYVEHPINKFDVDIFVSFCTTIGPNCSLEFCNTRNNGPTNFLAALMVTWIVHECVLLFLTITPVSTAFEPQISSVCLDASVEATLICVHEAG